MTKILGLDVSGQPVKWLNIEEAIHYYASNKVIFELGETIATLHGGHNHDGVQSTLSTKSIIAVSGESVNRKPHATLSDNAFLFRRDHNLCAYCGEMHKEHMLTRDHIIPSSRGGPDEWMNLVTACRACNLKKANHTPQEAGMELVYVPYRPTRWEGFILANRTILADQMEYLASKLPSTSRWALT